jgi:cysteine desulfurase
VQGYGRMPILEGADMIAITAHKIHGPKGIGALWIRDGLKLPPLLLGGAQEQGLRAGTVSPALVAGFGMAAKLCADRMAKDSAHVARLWDIAAEEMADWQLNGSAAQRYRGNFNIRKEGINATRLLSDARAIAFSLGSACGSGSGRTSHVLRAMGLSEGDARSSIRLGWGRYTTEADLRTGLTALKTAAALQGV